MSEMKITKSNLAKKQFLMEETVEMGNIRETYENENVNVFDDITYQSILGFGGAFTEASGYNYSLLDDENKKKFIKMYFDKKEGNAYNFGRACIQSTDFSLDTYTYVKEGDRTLESFSIERDKKYIIPLIKDAMEYCQEELILFASPWSPPAYMKDNESMVGGELLEDYKELWAQYYIKFIKAYAEEGIKISALTIQNEPKARNQTWECCYYSAQDEQIFIRDYLAPTLDREGLSDVKIIVWDHNKERVYDRTKEVLSDKTVSDRVWAVGHHWYSGDHFEGMRLVHEQLHKPLICTEFTAKIIWDVDVLAERYAVEMCENFNNFDIACCDWNILLDKNGGPYHDRDAGCYSPIQYDEKEKTVVATPIYYYMGHFSRFVHRGAKRIATTKYTRDLNTCAFINEDGSKVLIIINTSDKDLPVNIRYKGTSTHIETEAHSIATICF